MKVLEKTNEIIMSRKEYETLLEKIEYLEDVIDCQKAIEEGEFISWEEAQKHL